MRKRCCCLSQPRTSGTTWEREQPISRLVADLVQAWGKIWSAFIMFEMFRKNSGRGNKGMYHRAGG